MYFKLACPSCGKSLKVREELAGRKCKCPYCKSSVTVPMPSGIDLGLVDLAATDLGQFESPAAQTPAPASELPSVQTTAPQVGAGAAATPKAASSPTPRQETPKPAAQTAPSPEFVEGGKWTDSSNVSLLFSGLIGLGFTVAFLAAMLPFKSFYIGELFLARGWVPYVLVFLFGWSGAILFLKQQKLSRQKTAMLLDVLPTGISKDITIDTLDQYVEHVHSLPGEPGESYLINRVLRGLEHFRARQSTSETGTMMASQSEIDANNVTSSYTVLKVFIWAIPIMGFIGTVIGIGGAVAGFSGNLDASADVDKLKDSLNSVTGGLATAFDTTLIALVMSILIKFPTSSLQRSEESLLNWVDEYCNENLLRRLNDGRQGMGERGGGSTGADAKLFRDAVESAMATQQAELESWIERLKEIGSTVSTQVADGWEEVNAKLLTAQEQWAEQHQKQQEERAAELRTQAEENAAERAQQEQERAAEIQRRQEEHAQLLQKQLDEMGGIATGIQQTLSQLAEQAGTVQDTMLSSVSGSTETLQTHFSGLERGLTSLSGVLENLGEKQVLIQQVEKPRSGWFRRRNGGK